MQPVGRLSGRLRGTSEESHTGSEPLWSGWRQKDSIAVALLPEHRTWKRGMSVHFPLRVLHFMYSKEDGLLPPSVMYSVRCWVCCAQLMEEQKGEVSTRTTHYAVGQPTGVCVCFLPRPCPPGMQANIAGGERWAQGICFPGFLSFFLHMFYPSPPGRDCF